MLACQTSRLYLKQITCFAIEQHDEAMATIEEHRHREQQVARQQHDREMQLERRNTELEKAIVLLKEEFQKPTQQDTRAAEQLAQERYKRQQLEQHLKQLQNALAKVTPMYRQLGHFRVQDSQLNEDVSAPLHHYALLQLLQLQLHP